MREGHLELPFVMCCTTETESTNLGPPTHSFSIKRPPPPLFFLFRCADFVVLNKTDMLSSSGQLDSLRAIVSSLNPLAEAVACEQGRVPLDRLFGKETRGLVSRLNVEGHHRGFVAAAKAEERARREEEIKEESEKERKSKSGDHHHHHHQQQQQHAHGHKAHSHGEKEGGHSHDHKAHSHGEKGGGHSHEAHSHDHKDHKGHSHSERQTTSAARRFGIISFVYQRRVPFHPQRLRDLVLRWMPATHNKALAEGEVPAQGVSAVRTVLRSKGFCWLANSHVTAFYWSHAGKHFELREEGDWWAAVPGGEWPEDANSVSDCGCWCWGVGCRLSVACVYQFFKFFSHYFSRFFTAISNFN
jgi:G3E family GTPase